MQSAVTKYLDDVRSGRFPNDGARLPQMQHEELKAHGYAVVVPMPKVN